MRFVFGNRETFQYFWKKNQNGLSEIRFHLPPHSEQSTFTLDFLSMAFNKKFLYKIHFFKLQVFNGFNRGFTVSYSRLIWMAESGIVNHLLLSTNDIDGMDYAFDSNHFQHDNFKIFFKFINLLNLFAIFVFVIEMFYFKIKNYSKCNLIISNALNNCYK